MPLSETDVTPTTRTETAYETFLQYLEHCRKRMTKPRLKVARCLIEQRGLFDESGARAEAERRGMPVGPRSIATTLDLLVDSGVMVRVGQGFNEAPFYLSLANYRPDELILVCLDCLELRPVQADDKLRRVGQDHGYRVRWTTNVCKGVCHPCRDKRLSAAESLGKGGDGL